MVTADGSPIPPSPQLIRVLREARRLRRRGNYDALERKHEASMLELGRAREQQSRERLIQQISQTMRERNMRSYAQPRVFIPDVPK